ncbi:response regulator [Reichenbachiella versicolor]|uniref:response regulator n=1 Tax=Reichenbachiella versicolor TaxID=1821036 RepID=UPI000D6E38D0|nr:response regulator [Reichenbachiella versicolor]
MDSKSSILYVDDEEINRYIFEMLLQSTFNVYKADSGQGALEILSENPEIKLVITDWSMPKMDGLSFARKAKSLFKDKKIMMLSAYMKNREIDDAIANGVLKAYFSKPLDRESFLTKTKELGLLN